MDNIFILFFVETVNEEVEPPTLKVSNFKSLEKNATWRFVNQNYSRCPKCLNFIYVNTTTVKCIRSQRDMIEVIINWAAPKTSSPILGYTIAYGGKLRFLGKDLAIGTIRAVLPVSNVKNISYFFLSVNMYHRD